MHNRNFFYLAAWLIILEIFGSVADNLLTHYNFSLKKELCRENSLSNARVLDISILKVFRQSIFEHFETWNFLVCTYYLSGEFSVRQAQREVVKIKKSGFFLKLNYCESNFINEKSWKLKKLKTPSIQLLKLI